MRQIEETQTKWQSAIHDEFTRTSYDMMNNFDSVKKLPRQKSQTHMFHIDHIFLLWPVYKLLWMYSRWVSLAKKIHDKCHLIKTSCCHPQSFYHPVASLWSQTRPGQPSNWWVSDFLCRTIQQWNDPDWHCWEIALSLPNRSKHLGMIEALNLMICLFLRTQQTSGWSNSSYEFSINLISALLYWHHWHHCVTKLGHAAEAKAPAPSAASAFFGAVEHMITCVNGGKSCVNCWNTKYCQSILVTDQCHFYQLIWLSVILLLCPGKFFVAQCCRLSLPNECMITSCECVSLRLRQAILPRRVLPARTLLTRWAKS